MAMDFPDKRGAPIRKLTQQDGRAWGVFLSNLLQHELTENERKTVEEGIEKHRTFPFLHVDHMEKIIRIGTDRGMNRPKFAPKGYQKVTPDPEKHPLRYFWEALENPKKQRHRERRATLQNELQAARLKVSELLAVIQSKDELIQSQSDTICAKDELIAILKNQILQRHPLQEAPAAAALLVNLGEYSQLVSSSES